MAKQRKTFLKGWQSTRQVDMPELKRTIMEILGVTSKPSWLNCIYYGKSMTDLQATLIENEFVKRGVQRDDVWDDHESEWRVVVTKSGSLKIINRRTHRSNVFQKLEDLSKFMQQNNIPQPEAADILNEE